MVESRSRSRYSATTPPSPANARLQRTALLLLAGFHAGCGSSKGAAAGGAAFTFTSQGDGPTNAAPLNPLRVGSVLGAGIDTFIIDGVIQTETVRELRMTNVFSGNIVRVSHDSDGLFFTGSTVDGSASQPILVVPSKVRVGMAWDVFTDSDEPLFRFEVKERVELSETFFGRAVQWRIDQVDSAGEVIGRRYLEGRGSVDAPAVVMWNQDPQVAVEPAPAVELEALAAPASFGKRGWVETLSLVRVGQGPGLFIANDEAYENGGNIGWCASYSGGALTPMEPSPGPPYRRTSGLECVTTEYCAKVTGGSGGAYLDCSLSYASGQASGVVVGSDGQLTWLPRSNTGELAYGDMQRSGTDFSEVSYRGFAVVPDAEGKGNILYSHFAGYGDLLALGGAEALFGDPAQPTLVPNNLLGLPDLTRITPLSEDTGGRSTLLLQTKDGMLWSATLEGSTLSRPVRHTRLAGRLSVQATEKGNEVLRVTGDGLVQRLRIDAQGLGLDPVAQLSLPPGEQAHSAFLYREDGVTFLIAATLSPDGRDVRGPLIKLNLYRSTNPITPGATIRAQPVNGVRAVTAGPNGDVLVCWAAGGAKPSVEGWTIGGKSALAVAPLDVAGPCMQVFRTPGTPFAGESLNGSPYWTVEGPIPDQGRVTVRTGVSPNLGLTSGTVPPYLAPLEGGGFASGRRLYGAGGVLVGVPTGLLDGEPSPTGGLNRALPDAAGNGLWALTVDPIIADQWYLRRVGLTSISLKLPLVPGWRPSFQYASGGGGVVVGLPQAPGMPLGDTYVAPDGTMTPLPTLPADHFPMGRLADGTLCGQIAGTPNQAFCRAPSGAEVSQPLPADLAALPTTFFPNSDGKFVMLQLGHYALDSATAQVIDYPMPHLGAYAFTHAADGSLWGLATESISGGAMKLLRFGPSEPEEVLLPEGLLTTSERLARVIPDEKVLLGVAQNDKLITIPRPPP